MPVLSLIPTRFLALAALSTLPFLAACSKPADAQGGPPPAMPVSVVPATQRTVTDVETFSGRIEAAEFVELRARVAGTVDKVHFTDGAPVAKGQLLFSIDPRPFEAEVAPRHQRQLARGDAPGQAQGVGQKHADGRDHGSTGAGQGAHPGQG